MRFGLHSGPVTAGVLRADRARFQLFGDTVNTGKYAGWLGEHPLISEELLTSIPRAASGPD
jgi:Adenylate and Guanylate cyclase catalytic domain